MALRMAICDDNPADTQIIQKYAEDWLKQQGIEAALVCFPSAESFLFQYEESQPYDLLFLDVEMGEMDGVALAKELRTRGDTAQIVFITGYTDYMAQGYDVEALHYLIKPVDEQKLYAVLDRAVKRIAQPVKHILLETAEGIVRLNAVDVMFAEAMGHVLQLHTIDGMTHEARMSMKDAEKLLGEGFVRCHRSYLVNLKHIRRITRTDVVLDNGKVLPLSRRLYEAVNHAFIAHYREEE